MALAQSAASSTEALGSYRAQMLSFARMRLHNPAHAEDAVQDALLAALEGLDRFSGDAAMGTWLIGILKHKIVDCVRRSARDAFDPLDEAALGGAAGEPGDALDRCELLERLDRGLAAMPRRTAQVFLMRDVLGLSTAEACRELGISPANCAVLLYRARRRLREGLGAEGIGASA